MCVSVILNQTEFFQNFYIANVGYEKNKIHTLIIKSEISISKHWIPFKNALCTECSRQEPMLKRHL